MVGSVATTLLFAACNKENDNKEAVNAQDETFIAGASKSNRSEIELSTLVLQNGMDAQVKAYAQMMITEHTTSQNELKDIVGYLDTNVNLEDSLDADQIAMRNQLLMLSGTALDSVYISGQVTGHIKTLAIFDAELAGGQNARVKAFATKYRPGVASHLQGATTIRDTKFE